MQEELIGREPERAQLDVWVTEAMAGHGSLVLLSGEAGVGKTSLAKNTLTRSGLQTVEGFAIQGGTSPFGPIVEGLRSASSGRCATLSKNLGWPPRHAASWLRPPALWVIAPRLLEAIRRFRRGYRGSASHSAAPYGSPAGRRRYAELDAPMLAD